jgi:hypothetical protein
MMLLYYKGPAAPSKLNLTSMMNDNCFTQKKNDPTASLMS